MDIDALHQQQFSVWVPFDEDAEVLIAYVPRDRLQALAREATETRFVKHQKTRQYDSTEADRLLGREAVKNWRPTPEVRDVQGNILRPAGGGFRLKGQLYPYTPENCDLLMTKWNDFSRFVNETCVDLQTLIDAEQEAIRKNSSTTSGQE